ncbi:carbonic anhydrase1 [Zea mays]|uniref:Carbonic anhydrase n=1 Tax=Zea mays TaxID=4577 RepID=A0A1D6NHQ9_MAIZE|nr:carbonic anhydrase1 [Zea mays]
MKVKKEHASVPFDDQCSILEKEAVNVSLENLKTYPFVKEGLANGTLKLIGAHYDFVSGEFLTWKKLLHHHKYIYYTILLRTYRYAPEQSTYIYRINRPM